MRTVPRRLAALLSALLCAPAVAAAQSNASSPVPSAAPSPAASASPPRGCSVTVSGALSGTDSCTAVATVRPGQPGSVSIFARSPGSFRLNATVPTPAAPAPGTLSCAATNGVVVVRSHGIEWTTNAAKGPPPSSCTLVLRSVSPVQDGVATIHGTLEATLPPPADARTTMPVNVAATF